MSKYIMTENQRSMTPQLFEAIIFVKCNERFSDAGILINAIQKTLVDSSSGRVKTHELSEERFNDLR